MPTGSAIICRLKNLEPIEGADRIQKATVCGETVIVSKDHHEGELGILFDCETQLSEEFAHYNNLHRRSHLNYNKEVKGYLEDNRRIRPIKLKGVKCSGLWMPIESIWNCVPKDNKARKFTVLNEGTQLTEFGGVPICNKYVRKVNTSSKGNKKQRVSLKDLAPTFKEHVDTDHFMRNTQLLKDGQIFIITEKLHGTSFRCGNLPVIRNKSWFEKLLNKFGIPTKDKEYKFAVGSRRVVKSIEGQEISNKNHYYNEDIWTKTARGSFEGKLEKGETVYGELVGYTPDGNPIMGTHSNEKLKPFMDKKEYKEFIDRYGEETVFHYGCINNSLGRCQSKLGVNLEAAPINKLYVYRITRTNEDGQAVDLSWDQVKKRCEQLGVDHVPELKKDIVISFSKEHTDGFGESLELIVPTLANKESRNFPQHIREGVVVRIEDGGLTPIFLKDKNYYFKVLEGIIKDKEDFVDIEESN